MLWLRRSLGPHEPPQVLGQEETVTHTWTIATFARRTTLAGAALMATAVALPNVGATRKKSGIDCKKKEKQRCTNDAAACRTTVMAGCQNEDGCPVELRCCDECTADGFLTCFVASLD